MAKLSNKNTEANIHIGIGIKHFRKKEKLTLEELAKILGSSAGYLSEIERGIKIPGSQLIFSLKKNFKKLDLNKLFLIKAEDDPILENLTIDS